MAIGFSSFRFRTGIRRQGLEHLLPFKNWTYPYGPIISVILNGVLILVQGWTSFSPSFKAVDFVSFYVEIPVMFIMFVVWKLVKKTKFVAYEDMDFVTDRYEITADGFGGDGIPKGKPFLQRGWKGQLKTAGQWLFL